MLQKSCKFCVGKKSTHCLSKALWLRGPIVCSECFPYSFYSSFSVSFSCMSLPPSTFRVLTQQFLQSVLRAKCCLPARAGACAAPPGVGPPRAAAPVRTAPAWHRCSTAGTDSRARWGPFARGRRLTRARTLPGTGSAACAHRAVPLSVGKEKWGPMSRRGVKVSLTTEKRIQQCTVPHNKDVQISFLYLLFRFDRKLPSLKKGALLVW